VMFNPDNPGGNIFLGETTKAASNLNQQLMFLSVKSERDIDPAFDEIFRKQIKALLVWPDTFLFSQRARIVARAADHQIAVVSDLREFPAVGALASYGADGSDLYRAFGNYVGKILKGVKPADVPVLQPTKFQLVVNVKAADALGLTVPPSILARADEIIE
jgi:putative tryptophan/tyrosine transport system substrate-binding protein